MRLRAVTLAAPLWSTRFHLIKPGFCWNNLNDASGSETRSRNGYEDGNEIKDQRCWSKILNFKRISPSPFVPVIKKQTPKIARNQSMTSYRLSTIRSAINVGCLKKLNNMNDSIGSLFEHHIVVDFVPSSSRWSAVLRPRVSSGLKKKNTNKSTEDPICPWSRSGYLRARRRGRCGRSRSLRVRRPNRRGSARGPRPPPRWRARRPPRVFLQWSWWHQFPLSLSLFLFYSFDYPPPLPIPSPWTTNFLIGDNCKWVRRSWWLHSLASLIMMMTLNPRFRYYSTPLSWKKMALVLCWFIGHDEQLVSLFYLCSAFWLRREQRRLEHGSGRHNL